MTAYQLVWAKTWDQPICAPEACTHPCTETLTINQRLEPAGRGQQRIAWDARICMNCGTDTSGACAVTEGLSRCWDEHHLRPGMADRLHDLAAANEATIWDEGEKFPMWMMFAFGWSGREIVDALNSGELEAA